MRVLIVDPALRSMGGHHYNAVQRLQHELAALGVEAPCLGSAYADRTAIDGLLCNPVFTRSVYGRSYGDPREFARDVAETGRQLAQALRRSGVPDLVILPCCDQVLAAALACHLKRLRSTARPHVLLWLLYGPHHLMEPDGGSAIALHREARDAFAALAAEAAGVRAYCETAAMAEFYRALVPFDVGVMPGPGLTARARSARTVGGAPVVSCIGFANRAKGYRLLPEAVGLVLERHPDARFMIHGIVAGTDAESDRPVFDRLASLGRRVTVRHEVLTSGEYLDLLAESDLLLLPYHPDVYRRRGSGVFTDALRIGVPIVAPKACGFAGPAFDGGWGVAMEEYDGMALGSAALEGLDRLAALAARAAVAAGQAQDALAGILQEAVAAPRSPRPGLFGRLRRFGRTSAQVRLESSCRRQLW